MWLSHTLPDIAQREGAEKVQATEDTQGGPAPLLSHARGGEGGRAAGTRQSLQALMATFETAAFL